MEQYHNRLIITIQLFASSGDKTEAPTPKRRDEARKKGQIAKSQDVAQSFTLLVGLFTLNITFRYLYVALFQKIKAEFSSFNLEPMSLDRWHLIAVDYTKVFFMAVSPVLVGVLISGLIANYLQVGFLFTWEPIKPNFEKVNVLSGLKSLFSLKKLFELVKTLIKLTVIGYYAYSVITDNVSRFMKMADMGFFNGFTLLFTTSYDLIFKVTTGLLIIAGIDYLYQRHEHEKSLKMSKQEIKDEYKQTEGDPQIKGRLRQMQKDLLRKKMIEDVPKATVVITNPTHLSIALKYERGMGAPEVVAKGADHMAFRIREIATEHGIPLMENKPLARAMYPVVEVGDEIPEEYYQAVAEILAIFMDD